MGCVALITDVAVCAASRPVALPSSMQAIEGAVVSTGHPGLTLGAVFLQPRPVASLSPASSSSGPAMVSHLVKPDCRNGLPAALKAAPRRRRTV